PGAPRPHARQRLEDQDLGALADGKAIGARVERARRRAQEARLMEYLPQHLAELVGTAGQAYVRPYLCLELGAPRARLFARHLAGGEHGARSREAELDGGVAEGSVH